MSHSYTPTHQTNEKKPTPKWVEKAETQSRHKLHSWHSNRWSGGNSQIWASNWGVGGLSLASGTPAFETFTCEVSPRISRFESQRDLHLKDPQAYSELKSSSLSAHAWLPCRDQCKGSWVKSAQSFCVRGLLACLHSCSLRCKLQIKHLSKGWL